jgi:hypothetical protein
MAKGIKTGGRNFISGTSGNPSGRPKVPEDVRSALSLNQVSFVRIANELLAVKVSELDEIVADESQPVFKIVLASILQKAIESADHRRLEFFLDRLIGKPKQTVETEGESTNFHAKIMELIRETEAANQ